MAKNKPYYMPSLDYDWFGEKPTGNYYVKRGNITEIHSMPGKDINWNEVRQLFDETVGSSDGFLSDVLMGNFDDFDDMF